MSSQLSSEYSIFHWNIDQVINFIAAESKTLNHQHYKPKKDLNDDAKTALVLSGSLACAVAPNRRMEKAPQTKVSKDQLCCELVDPGVEHVHQVLRLWRDSVSNAYCDPRGLVWRVLSVYTQRNPKLQ